MKNIAGDQGFPRENRKTILLVEDNERITSGNKWLFERQGYETVSALNLSEARALVSELRPDAIVLDIMLPDGSGLDFMRELREGNNSGIPILLLTGLTTKEDILNGLKSGGDDYLTKPYDFDELLARVEALLRRSARVPEVITRGRLTLDVTAGVAGVAGPPGTAGSSGAGGVAVASGVPGVGSASGAGAPVTDLLLTQKEFALLLVFVQNEGRSVSAEYLYEKVWKAPMSKDDSALKNAVSKLRKKLAGSGYKISSERGAGYILERD